jgi:hypothetical protein
MPIDPVAIVSIANARNGESCVVEQEKQRKRAASNPSQKQREQRNL